jgi:hypothetical protein
VAFCAGTKCQILTTSSARRKETQRRFNMDPAKDPLRILLATDAAREGLSFQAHCADLFHFDTYALGRSNPSVQLARRKKSFKLNIRQKKQPPSPLSRCSAKCRKSLALPREARQLNNYNGLQSGLPSRSGVKGRGRLR